MIGVLGFDSWRGLWIFLFTTASRTALGPTQPPIQWVPGALSLGIKRPGCEADHSPPSNAEVKEWVELYLHFPIRLHGVALSKSAGTTLTFSYVSNSLGGPLSRRCMWDVQFKLHALTSAIHWGLISCTFRPLYPLVYRKRQLYYESVSKSFRTES
jgi:hypothetical protein